MSSSERGRQQERERTVRTPIEAQEGRLPFFRTLGGHRRYPDAEIRALLEILSELSPAG